MPTSVVIAAAICGMPPLVRLEHARQELEALFSAGAPVAREGPMGRATADSTSAAVAAATRATSSSGRRVHDRDVSPGSTGSTQRPSM